MIRLVTEVYFCLYLAAEDRIINLWSLRPIGGPGEQVVLGDWQCFTPGILMLAVWLIEAGISLLIRVGIEPGPYCRYLVCCVAPYIYIYACVFLCIYVVVCTCRCNVITCRYRDFETLNLIFLAIKFEI